MSDQFRTICLQILLALFAVALFGGATANAQGTAWHVSKASGDVTISASGAQPAALTDTTTVNPGDVIRTGASGRVLLTRGAETILVSANSVVGLPTDQQGGMSTTILQQAGTILLEVEKRNVKHFQVETPYLAAVVKGTQFRVSVGKDDSRVEVLRGQVEVVDFKTGQYTQVFPAQSARVSAQGAGGLSLSGGGTLSPIEQGSPRRSPVSPLPESQTQTAALAVPAAPAGPAAATDLAPNAQPSWVPGHDYDTIHAVSRVDEREWSGRLLAMLKGVVNPDHKAGDDSYTTLDFALPIGAGVIVAFGVAIGRRRKTPKEKQPDPLRRIRR